MSGRVLLDENWQGQRTWFALRGYDVAVIADGREDGEVVQQALVEARVIITRDRDFQRLWRRASMKFKAVIVQRGAGNSRWPVLMPRALGDLAEQPGVAMIRQNRLTVLREEVGNTR